MVFKTMWWFGGLSLEIMGGISAATTTCLGDVTHITYIYVYMYIDSYTRLINVVLVL